MSSQEPIVIWGAGAIGGTIGAYWVRAGISVLLVDIVREHVEACRTSGLVIEGPIDNFTQVIPAKTPDELQGVYSRIVLAVKAPATEAALDALEKHLTPDGYVLSAQNGLNEIAISRRLGAERTMGCFVNFGADWLGPGRIIRGNRASVVVGEIDGTIRARTRAMHDLLRVFEPDAELTENIWGYLWGKLAYGAMLFATALNDDSISANFDDLSRFIVFDRLAREVMQVAAARKIRPLGFSGFDPGAFFPGASEARSRASVADLAEFNRHSAKTHSGIWRDLAVRKRKTEIDPQIGIIAALGHEAGVDTPAIRKLVELIHDIEDGRRERSTATFNILTDACRSLSAAA